MIQLDLFFARGWRGGWLAVCLCWLLGSTALAQGQAAAPFMVRATPAGSVGLQVGQEQLLTATAVYPAFLSAGFDGPVLATAVQPDGKTLVGGRFTHCGTSTRQYLARLNADGTLDDSFTMGTELDSAVYALAVQADGRILVGGNFTAFGGIPRQRLARLSATGALDQTFDISSGFDGPVRAIAEQFTNNIRQVVVGGDFSRYGSLGTNTNSNYLVRLTNTGILDIDFARYSHTTPNIFTGRILALVVQPNSNGSILVGGAFGISASAPHRGIARLNSIGTLDGSFSSPNDGPTGGEIAAIAVVGSNIAVGGSFIGYTSGGSPQAQSRLALLSSTGELVPGFTSQFATATSQRVNSLVALSATQLLAGGEFSIYAWAPRGNLVALDAATGSLNPTYDALRATFNAPVYSLAQQPGLSDANVVVGGAFTTVKGGPIRASRIARLRPTGRPDDLDVPVPGPVTYQWTTGQKDAVIFTSATGLYWATATVGSVTNTSNTVALTVAAPTLAPITVKVTPVGPLTAPAKLTATAAYPALQVGTGFEDGMTGSRYVWSFKTQANGKLVVGGRFTSYNGKPCQYITRLHADGIVDPTFTQTGINATVTLVSVQPDGKILVGGDFSSLNPAPGPDHLARLNTDGSLDTSFKGGFGNSPMGIVYQPDGKMLMAGNFVRYYTKGIPISNFTPVRYVVRLMPDGALDPTFTHTLGVGPSGREGLDEYVQALALQPDGKVLVGGEFTYYGPTPRQRVARLNADGSLDSSFNPTGGNLNNVVVVLALQPDGKVLVGGNFADYLVRLNADGSPDPSFAVDHSRVSASVASLVLQSDGKILVGGTFPGSLLRLNADGSLDPTFAITGAGLDGKVATMAIQADGQVLVGGAFANYASTTGNRKGLARLNANGTLNDTDTPVPGTATYAWSDGSTGPTLTVAANGIYSTTATFLGQTAISNSVVVGVPAPFTVRITPTGPLSLCPGTSQTLTAQVAAPATGTYTWNWYKVQSPGVFSSLPSTANANFYVVNANAPGQYVATATDTNGAVAASATVSVGTALPPTLTNSVTGLPGTGVVLQGTNLEQVTEVLFTTSPPGQLAAFTFIPATLTAPTALAVTVPTGATPGAISVRTACSSTPILTSASLGFPPPTIASLSLAGALGNTVVVTGINFVVGAGATTATLSINGVTTSVPLTVVSSTQLLLTIPSSGLPTGSFTVSASVTTAGVSSSTFTATLTGSAVTGTTDFNTTITLPAGIFYANQNILIRKPAVVTILGSSPTDTTTFRVNRLEVQEGATLNLPNNMVIAGGSGSSFLLAAGATLTVGHPNGLGSAAAPGAIRLATLFFSPDASYGYSGTQPQATGTNLPSRVRDLTSTNSSRLTLSQPVSIAQELTMAGTGHFFLNNQALTLLSNATGTALAVNKPGAGRVLGTATVQRYINPVANAGTGFRYYGSPVKGATAAVLAAPAFDYDQSRYRLTAQKDTLPLISYGFTTSALVPNTPLQVGHGYRAAVPAATTVQFTGTLTTGDTTITLIRKGNETYNGWNLVSNPYPSPLNWTKLVAAADAVNLEAAIYVYESAGTNTGTYRSYVNGVSNDKLINQTADGDLLIAMGQAFFVRVREGQTTGTLTFRDDHRENSYTRQASFSRTAARPFEISAEFARNGGGTIGGGGCNCGHSGHSSHIALYLDTDGATSFRQSFNPKLDADARNLFSFSQQTLSIRGGAASGDSTLAIRAIAPPTGPQIVPLVLSATAPGSYSIQVGVEELSKLTPGLVPYLHDLNPAPSTSGWHNLSGYAAPALPLRYTFDLSATEVLGTIINRFEIVFQPVITATTPASTGLGSVEVFPNPAQHRIHVVVPAVPGATQVQATLFNTMGQVVLRQSTPLPAAGTALNLGAEKLAGGVYILRLQAGGSIATRRVVLEN
jgi:uncharacterized delta-60 repeat protein